MIDLEVFAAKWLRTCGPCDLGMPEYGCNTAAADAVDRAHAAIKDDDECAAIRAERWWLDA